MSILIFTAAAQLVGFFVGAIGHKLKRLHVQIAGTAIAFAFSAAAAITFCHDSPNIFLAAITIVLSTGIASLIAAQLLLFLGGKIIKKIVGVW